MVSTIDRLVIVGQFVNSIASYVVRPLYGSLNVVTMLCNSIIMQKTYLTRYFTVCL